MKSSWLSPYLDVLHECEDAMGVVRPQNSGAPELKKQFLLRYGCTQEAGNAVTWAMPCRRPLE